MLWAWFWKARYWQHETFLETNWRWGDTNFMSHALLGFLGNMSSQDHLLQLLKLLPKPLFYCTFCSAFSLDKFCGLCHTILLSKSRCTVVSHPMEKLWFLFKNWTPCIWFNTFVPNFSISQIRLKSKFKTNFYDSKSKLKNVLLHTFPVELSLKFSP